MQRLQKGPARVGRRILDRTTPRIKLLQFRQRHVRDITLAVRRAIDFLVVEHHEHAVLRPANVDLDADPQLDACGIARQSILRRFAQQAAMADDRRATRRRGIDQSG